MSKKQTICLNMIVKDEQAVIIQCLESIKNLIDYWVIVDTGSSDNTRSMIQSFFAKTGVPGELLEHPWVNFAENRNRALDAARDKADYILFMDADDYLVHDDNFRFDKLNADIYYLRCQLEDISYYRQQIINASVPWYWGGVVHEGLYCDDNFSSDRYGGDCYLQATQDGARAQNPDRFKEDIKLLQAALADDPDNTRNQFYLAQSYRDDRNYDKAIDNYLKRATMGGWEEEVYISLSEAGRLQLLAGHPYPTALNTLLKAYHYRPTRLEALYHAVGFCRRLQLYDLGYALGIEAIATAAPTEDLLFVDNEIHAWQFMDEVAICASLSNHKSEARKLTRMLLENPQLPAPERQRIEANLDDV